MLCDHILACPLQPYTCIIKQPNNELTIHSDQAARWSMAPGFLLQSPSRHGNWRMIGQKGGQEAEVAYHLQS